MPAVVHVDAAITCVPKAESNESSRCVVHEGVIWKGLRRTQQEGVRVSKKRILKGSSLQELFTRFPQLTMYGSSETGQAQGYGLARQQFTQVTSHDAKNDASIVKSNRAVIAKRRGTIPMHENWRPQHNEVLANPVRSGSPAAWLRPDCETSVVSSPAAFHETPQNTHNSNKAVCSSSPTSPYGGAGPINVGSERAAAEAREPVDLSPSLANGSSLSPAPRGNV